MFSHGGDFYLLLLSFQYPYCSITLPNPVNGFWFRREAGSELQVERCFYYSRVLLSAPIPDANANDITTIDDNRSHLRIRTTSINIYLCQPDIDL